VKRLRSVTLAVTALVALGAIVSLGCSDGRPARVPVSGRVVIDGKPLSCGFVRLISPTTRPAGGQIGSDGRFHLGCFDERDGAPLGTHKVTVTAQKVLDSRRTRWLAPKKYVDPETSGLTATISGPTDALTIELTWAGGKPFVETAQGE